MIELLHSMHTMYVIVALVSMVVLFAMTIDLIFGWRKAKQRGEAHTSYALSRSINKFLLYEGSVLIATGIDTLLNLANLWDVVGLAFGGIPVVAIVIGIFLCTVELLSMRENAEDKVRKNFDKVAHAATKVIDKDTIVDLLAEAIKKSKEK
ncbi:MAG: phage holin family protein [Phocaeicola sp.]|nr:phage holin family protein [Phocaeicola sp.]